MATEVKEETGDGVPVGVLFVVEVLNIIKDAQLAHGLRHGDFQRYRQYVTRKLRRMRKSLHFPKGSKYKVQPKTVSAEMLAADHRFLIMLVFEAERAWSYAMQLKPEANTEPRKKFHMLSRFRKAVQIADEVVALSKTPECDARTQLECQAYAGWMRGNLLFELQQFAPAKEALEAAQTIYARLADLLEEDQRQRYLERVRELDPQLRYCAFETEGDAAAVEALKAMRAEADINTEQLDSLLAQTRADQAAAVVEVTWLEHCIPIRLEKARVFAGSLKDWDSQLAGLGSDAKVSLYESILHECTDALQAVREEIRAAAAGDSSTGSMQLLQQYLQFVKLSKTAERNLCLIESAKSRSPQELARLYDSIVQSLQELRGLPALADEARLQNELDAKTLGFRAFRCYNLSQAYLAHKKFAECSSLLQRGRRHAEHSLKSIRDCDSPELANVRLTAEQLEQLAKTAEAEGYACRAAKLMDAVSVSSADDERAPKELLKKPLIDRLDSYAEDPSLSGPRRTPGAQPFIPMPPDFEPVAAKPVFFDLANNHIDFPPLDDLVESGTSGAPGGGITGFVKGWIGWGGKK